MNEVERESQVSALFDGELDESQSGLVVRRILKDPSLRATWSRYAVVGASLRGEPLSLATLGGSDVAARVASALALEPELPRSVAAPSGARRAWSGAGSKAAFGGALAAGVAAASLLVMRLQGDPQANAAPLQIAHAQAPAAVVAEPAGLVAAAESAGRSRLVAAETVVPAPAYTTPEGSSSNGALPAPLVNYVVAHSEYLTPVMRFNPLSAVVMGSFEPGELVEATEAEIGAVRR